MPAVERVAQIMSHLKEPSHLAQSYKDIVIVDVIRTPITRARTGAFKDMLAGDLMADVLKALLQRYPGVKADVGEVAVGNVLCKAMATHARMAALVAGLPTATAVHALSRQCASGLQALVDAVRAVQNRQCEVAVAVGVESMSTGDMVDIGDVSPSVFDEPRAAACLTPMGATSDELARRYSVSREKQDAFAVESHRRALAAAKEGIFAAEIAPVSVDGRAVAADEGPRECTTADLSRLRAAFGEGGTATAGNSSQLSDGAAAALVCTRAYAQKHGLPVLGCLRSFAVCGVDPAVMGVGPAAAIPLALAQAGVAATDVSVFEINEAFASQALWCAAELGLPAERVNPHGGAIALGHPLGCSGLRLAGTALREAGRRGKGLAVASMCIGTGMGAAAVLEGE